MRGGCFVSIHKGFGVNGCAVFADGEMQVGVLPDLEQRRAPDGADRLPGLNLVPGGDNGCGGQILIVRDAAVVVPDDDRRAEQLVVIDRAAALVFYAHPSLAEPLYHCGGEMACTISSFLQRKMKSKRNNFA